ncbi:hypothetical protein M569_01767 [Genlisea aurea]|uniref:Pentacotripeptide-repeat region of PRORP domain-containing protein n=1 Tax=Genlisea aurea TaxID=192259 RepID=S8D0T1_9LAMI|nr:hypothetical protein M569_01767 [Genlisea aurea]
MLHLSSLLKSGFSPTAVDFNRFFVHLLRNGRFKAIIHLFSQLGPAEINADDAAQTRTAFVRALLEEKRYDEAAEFLNTHSRKSKILDRNRLFDRSIQGICTFRRDPELGFSLLKDFSKTHYFPPSSLTFCALLQSFIETEKTDRVFDAIKLMSDSKLKFPFDNYVCSCVVSRLMRTGKPELAIRFHGIAVELGHIKPYSAAYSSVLSAYSQLRNVDEVPHLVTWFQNNNNDSAMEIMLYSTWLHEDCLREGGFIWEAFKIFRTKLGLKIDFDDTIGYTLLIDEFSKWGFVEKAFGILYKMKKHGHEPNLLTYAAVIWGFCRKRKLDEATTVFGMLKKSFGFEADEFTYAIVIRGACSGGDIDLVLDLLDKMDRRGMMPGIVTYEAVVDSLSDVDAKNMAAVCNALMKTMLMVGMYEDCLSIYKAVRLAGGLSPDSGMYRNLVDGYCKTGRIDELLEIFDDVRRTPSSSESSADFLNLAASRLCEMGFADMAVELLAESVVDLFERREVCSNAVSHLCKKGFPEAAYGVLLLAVKNGDGSASSYYCILKSLLLARKTAMARLVSTPFVKLRGLSDVRVRKIAAHLLCLRDVGAAVRFLARDEEELRVVLPAGLFRTLIRERRYSDLYELTMAGAAGGRLPRLDVFDYSIMIDGLCKGGRVVGALDLCRTAEEEGVALGAVAYNSVLNGLCREGCLVEAFRLFRSMAVEPTEVTYGTLIDSLVRRGMVSDARALFDEMFRRGGAAPNTHIYNSMMVGYSRANRAEEVAGLLEDLEARRMAPDEFTVAALMEWRCSGGDVEGALGLFLKFAGEGLAPDFAGFMVLIRGLCGKGRMEEARNVVRWMVEEKRGMVGSDSVAGLVSGLCEQGRVVEAVGVLEGVFAGNRGRRV